MKKHKRTPWDRMLFHLDGATRFRRKDVEEALETSDRSAKNLILEWLGEGRIVREGVGRSTRYRLRSREGGARENIAEVPAERQAKRQSTRRTLPKPPMAFPGISPRLLAALDEAFKGG